MDLHTHSPASWDFGPPSARDAKDWEAWVRAAASAGLEAVAITDHNTAGGVDGLRAAAARVVGAPIILPGVELTSSCNTHLLAIFDSDCSAAHVEDLLSRANVPVNDRGTQHARSNLGVEQLLSIANDCGVLFVGAHVNGPSGLLELDGKQRILVLRHPYLLAVEVAPEGPSQDVSWIDGSRPEQPRALPQIWCSDAHAHGQLGSRFTWVKMTKPGLEGLRLAFLDGGDSFRPGRLAELDDPNRHADCVLERIEIRGAKYMGRPEPFVVELNPWLNAVIGGRGTGKSTVVDLLRATLRRDGELDVGDGRLRASYDARMKVSVARADEALLTDTTEVEVIYRKDGERFVISWDPNGKKSAIARIGSDGRTDEPGAVHERFPVRIYSQKQLFDLAMNPNALLNVIDDTEVVRGAESERVRQELETRYLAARAAERALRARAADLPARDAALADVRRRIALLQESGNTEILNTFQVRRRQDGAWLSIEAAARKGITEVRRAVESLAVADLERGAGPDDPARASLQEVHERVRSIVDGLKQSALTSVSDAERALDSLRESEPLAAWRAVVASAESAYEDLARAGIADPNEYRDLLQRAATLEQESAKLRSRAGEAEERATEAVTALTQFRSHRSNHTQTRVRHAKDTSSDLVRIEILPYARRERLDAELRRCLGTEKFDAEIDALSARFPRDDEPWTFDALDNLVEALRRFSEDPDAKWSTTNSRFEAVLRKVRPESIDRLALFLPDDGVDAKFSDPRAAKEKWQSLASGSPGQKTAALLAFVLGHGTEPMILDQPEDDLDNTLIYDLLVKRLRETKQARQLIVVTHNANIVVHGDAELVVSLGRSTLHPGQSAVLFAGGLQEEKARKEICDVMEGGREAFESRYARIMRRRDVRHG